MTSGDLPGWALVAAALLLLASGALTLIAAIGMLRLPTFFQRMHAPSMSMTLGAGCALIASMIVSSALAHRPVLHELAITVLLFVTAPISATMLMQAAIRRRERAAASQPTGTSAGSR
ncbi:MAG TPA: monovalent cation/H(+) antiporter subunit G [Steroidobacteraceae bacterium]|nr:monovalent cation/H(+) antiporter subunit G [Steroidobacteraceae bacterium]